MIRDNIEIGALDIDVFGYVDYRSFLVDWRIAAKAKDKRISNEFICRKLRVSNRSYYMDLEKGTRKIGTDMQERLCNLMNLNSDQSKYFRALVGFGQPASPTEKGFWFEQLISLNHTPKRIVSPEQYEFYHTWYHTTVRALLDTYEYKGDAKDASRRLLGRVSPKEITESVALLCKLGLVEKVDGIFRVTGKVVSTGENATSELLKQFQIANISLIKGIIEANEPKSHNSAILTLSLSESAKKMIEEQLKAFRSKIIAIAHKDAEPATEVVKISMHLIPESQP